MSFEKFNSNQPAYRQPIKQNNTDFGGDGNNSGQGPNSPVPDSVAKRFNWGACLLSWIWGLGNKTYITLIIFIAGFIPFVGIIAIFGLQIWFGIKGNEWAWQNKRFNSIEHFHGNQKKWAIAGTIIAIVGTVVTVLCYSVMFALLMPSATVQY